MGYLYLQREYHRMNELVLLGLEETRKGKNEI